MARRPRSHAPVERHDRFDDQALFGVLWGKSNASGKVNLLLQHLLDTAAVAECLWDWYLAPAVRARVDACCGGRGRLLLALLCGLHDVGKASPAFQGKVEELAGRVCSAGLACGGLDAQGRRWHHSSAGAVVAGHHGLIGGESLLERPRGSLLSDAVADDV